MAYKLKQSGNYRKRRGNTNEIILI
jgi:hypothetical protein